MSHKHQQFTSLIIKSLLSRVNCFVPKSEEFVPGGICSTVSLLLRTSSWGHKCWISLCFALPNHLLRMIRHCCA